MRGGLGWRGFLGGVFWEEEVGEFRGIYKSLEGVRKGLKKGRGS